MAERTTDQILDEAVYAVACVAHHYGPGLNEEGLRYTRELLSKLYLFMDAEFRCDMEETDEFVDFHNRIIWPEGWDTIPFNNV
jgi:hypothetical protein